MELPYKIKVEPEAKNDLREAVGYYLAHIATLDQTVPSMLDTEKPSEVKRLYSYLEKPTLTSL